MKLLSRKPLLGKVEIEKLIISLGQAISILSLQADEAICQQQGKKTIVCQSEKRDQPPMAEISLKAVQMSPLIVKEWQQEWTVLPWFSALHTRENYTLKNGASELASFDRIELIKLAVQQERGALIDSPLVPVVPLQIPNDSFGLQVKDELGILWGERTEQMSGERKITGITPRFPLASGWKTFLSVSFYQKLPPLWRKNRITLRLPLAQTILPDAPIETFTACISLPEDAR